MRLLLDEMFSPQIARTLRNESYDVVAIAERAEWRLATDDRVIEIARRERRAIVTDNLRDYRPRAATAALPGGPGHYGMVFVPGGYRRTKADTGRILAALEATLTEHPGERDLHNQETWL